MDKRTIDIINKHFNEIKKDYDGLELISTDNGLSVQGDFTFKASYNGYTIQDTINIQINFPADYPRTLPTVKEIGNRIPKDFHTNEADGTLCLGVSFELNEAFLKDSTLKGYLNNLVIKFLYCYCYLEKNGKLPYGERAHGAEGILEAYKEEFDIMTDVAIVDLLKILAENNYRGHIQCPCGSGNRLRKCHGPSLLKVQNYQRQYYFVDDFKSCLEYLLKKDYSLSDFQIDNKKLRKILKVLKRQSNNIN